MKKNLTENENTLPEKYLRFSYKPLTYKKNIYTIKKKGKRKTKTHNP